MKKSDGTWHMVYSATIKKESNVLQVPIYVSIQPALIFGEQNVSFHEYM